MYTDITTVEEVFKRHPKKIELQKAVDALAFLPSEFSSGMIALLILQAACFVINNDDPAVPEFIPDYNNDDQEKWAPWYVGGDASGSGFRFRVSVNVWTVTGTLGGARLALKDEERADHMNEHFQEQYKNLWLILKQ